MSPSHWPERESGRAGGLTVLLPATSLPSVPPHKLGENFVSRIYSRCQEIARQSAGGGDREDWRYGHYKQYTWLLSVLDCLLRFEADWIGFGNYIMRAYSVISGGHWWICGGIGGFEDLS